MGRVDAVAEDHRAVLLGTATPSLESYHNAVQEKYRLLNLTQRVDECQMPLMRIVDLRLERRKEKVAAILSEHLRKAITARAWCSCRGTGTPPRSG